MREHHDIDPTDAMSTYDREAWKAIQRTKDKQLSTRTRRRVPERISRRVARAGHAARERVKEVPGAARIQQLTSDVGTGLTEWLSAASTTSLRRSAIVNAYRKAGHEVSTISDIHTLELADVDRVKPRFDVAYITAGMASGAGAALAITGGEVGAPAGAVATAGASAGPGVGTVAAAIAGDAAVTLGATMRLIAHTATYYGYDVNLPEERLTALGVLDFATVGQSGKSEAYIELSKLMNALARSATWNVLDQNLVTKLVKPFYARLAERLTKRKLATAAPVVGIVIGAGLNASTLARAAARADLIYRERFLRDKYAIDFPLEILEADVIDLDADEIPLVELVEEVTALEEAAAVEETAVLEPTAARDDAPASEAPNRTVGIFELQFDPAEIPALAERFSYNDDEDVVAAGVSARERGHYTRTEFLLVCRWKTPRSAPKTAQNMAPAIKRATRDAFRGEDLLSQITSLTSLEGVGVPTASTLLHFAFPGDFPILDVRALESLGVKGRSTYTTRFWADYVAACRTLAARYKVSLRTLDKALWQHSRERAAK